MTEETNNNENGTEIKEIASEEAVKAEMEKPVAEDIQENSKPATMAENEASNSPIPTGSKPPENREGRPQSTQNTTTRGRQQQSRMVRPQPYRNPRFKRRGCHFCQDKNLVIHYRKPEILEKFITDRGKILPRRITGACSKHQRAIAVAIKRARILSLLPFIVK